MGCVTKEGVSVVVYSLPQSHGWVTAPGLKILVLSKESVCLLFLREIAYAQYLLETVHGGKVPWIQEWPMEERFFARHWV